MLAVVKDLKNWQKWTEQQQKSAETILLEMCNNQCKTQTLLFQRVQVPKIIKKIQVIAHKMYVNKVRPLLLPRPVYINVQSTITHNTQRTYQQTAPVRRAVPARAVPKAAPRIWTKCNGRRVVGFRRRANCPAWARS